MKTDIIESVKTALEAASTEQNRISGKRYFKEEVALIGVTGKDVKNISRNYYREVEHLPKSGIFDICEEMWQTGCMELSFIACDWTYNRRNEFVKDDFVTFERWVKNYINNWASCDTFCNHSMGDFIVKYPEFLTKLKDWAKSENRWVKRAAAVSLIIPGKKGEFLGDIFGIADIMLPDKDDMVQKGYGWMLKAASHTHQKEVFDYVIKNKSVMPRTALRYAIEKMPADLKAEAMKK